jgi:hypothetical protein
MGMTEAVPGTRPQRRGSKELERRWEAGEASIAPLALPRKGAHLLGRRVFPGSKDGLSYRNGTVWRFRAWGKRES